MKLLLLIITISFTVHSKECELTVDGKSIKLHRAKKGCEFPEGNKIKCAQIITKIPAEPSEIGPIVFREGMSFKGLCLGSSHKKIPGSKLRGRIVSSVEYKGIYALMKCPSDESKLEIHLFNQGKTKKCELKL